MNVLWVFAHPEPSSLSGTLRDEGIDELRGRGHEVVVSDLYAMGWDPVVGEGARYAYRAGSASEEVLAEQRKLERADALVLQFPLWWLGMPAILKGWVDQVFADGFAFGVRDPATGHARRYGDGGLAGRRALLVTTIGAREASFGPRGIHGALDEVLFPIQHGLFWYAGMEALPPFTVYGADRATPSDVEAAAGRLRATAAALPDAAPVPFRHQDGGDYDERFVLRPHLAPGGAGLGVHYAVGSDRPCSSPA